jgi:signal peptidase I
MEKDAGVKRITLKEYVIQSVFKFVGVILITCIIFNFVLGIFILHGNYMFPAVRDGDLCITYRLEKYIIGDVVLYNTGGKERVGRIVAVEGQTVEITDSGELLVDGVPPAEQIFYPTDKGTLTYPCIVGNGQVFILNDFRSVTEDSREFGPIDIKDLDGKFIFSVRKRGF